LRLKSNGEISVYFEKISRPGIHKFCRFAIISGEQQPSET